jgi:hypothetical protein
VLAQIGREATPVIRAALTNANTEICRAGVLATGWSKEIGQEVVPELTALISSSDRLLANYSAMQLRRLLLMEEFVRVASGVSGIHQYAVQRLLLRSLAESKTNVAFAVPAVVSMLTSPDEAVRKLATNALLHMDSTAAAAHGVHTNAPKEIPGR